MARSLGIRRHTLRRGVVALLTALIVTGLVATPVMAAVGVGVVAFDCGYDVGTNTLRPIVAIERFGLDDPTDSRASVALRLFDVDAPGVQLAQLGTGVTDDGVEQNGAFNVPDGLTRSFTPEAGAVFGDGGSGGPALTVDHDYLLVARLFDFSSVEELVVNVATCRTTPENVDIDTDGDGLSDAEEVDLYGTDPLDADTDDDTLGDGIEILGYDHGDDGSIDVNLPAIGVSALHKDILVEIDMMTGLGPEPSAIELVMEAFDSAPVANPDGSTGIRLHVDYGPSAPSWGSGTWDADSRATVITFDPELGTYAAPNYDWSEFHAIRGAAFEVARRPIFHYAVWASSLPATMNAGGVARGIPASDFIVADAEFGDDPFLEASVFMHELGHNLGLRHGGNDDVNWKPNYLSVMNYVYQIQGIIFEGTSRHLDYSRFALPTLDEHHLVESSGIGAPSAYGTFWFCGVDGLRRVNNAAIVDWDCSGLADGTDIEANINEGLASGQDTDLDSALTSRNDWATLLFAGGAIGDYAGTFTPPTLTQPEQEPNQDMVDAMPNLPPEAADGSVTTDQDTPADVVLSASDLEDDPLAFTIVDAPDHGTLDDCSLGFCTYTPELGFSGVDTFSWKASDGTSESNVATFTVTILASKVSTVTNDAAGAAALAAAMVRDAGQLNGAAFVTVPGAGTPHGTSVAMDDFPTDAATFAILTSGDASLADNANSSPGSGANLGGPNIRGDSDYDVTVLRLDLTAPSGANCLRLDLAFYSEEFPEYVGSYNDAFIAELDGSTWTTSGQDISAPDNFAFDATGDVISVNSSGATSMSDANAAGTTYDGATVLLRAGTQVAPGAHSLYLSIFDQGDHILDSAVFIDDVRFVTVQDPAVDCAEGAEVPTNDPPVAIDDGATTAFETPVNVAVLANDSDPDGDSLTVTGATDPAHGSTTVNPDGTVTYTPDPGFSGIDTFEYTISDGHGGTDTATVTVTVEPDTVNPAPTSDAGGPYNGTEGSTINLNGTVTNEPGTDSVTQAWSYTLGAGTDAGMTCSFGNANLVDTTITCTDDGSVTVKLTVSDGVNPPVEDTATVTIGNADPTVSITSPSDGATFAVGATVNVSATIGDAGSNDSHTCSIDWGDGTTTAGVVAAGICTGSHAYAAVGAPAVRVTGTDDDGGTGSDEILLVIATGGTKVTGGGWILSGGLRVRFGFVAQSGDPFDGELQLRWGTHRFHGKTVTSLTTSRPTASWSGNGRYDGTDGYTYSVFVMDNSNGSGKNKTPDTFAIEIRDASGNLVYSAFGSLGGGNIKVH